MYPTWVDPDWLLGRYQVPWDSRGTCLQPVGVCRFEDLRGLDRASIPAASTIFHGRTIVFARSFLARFESQSLAKPFHRDMFREEQGEREREPQPNQGVDRPHVGRVERRASRTSGVKKNPVRHHGSGVGSRAQPHEA